MSTIVDFSIAPMDKGESVGRYVARAAAIIRESGLPYRPGPMGTSIEGEWPQVMAVVDRCFKALEKDCRRITITLRADFREGTEGRIDGKVRSAWGNT